MKGSLFSKPQAGKLSPTKKKPATRKGSGAETKRAIGAAFRDRQWRQVMDGRVS